MLEVQCYNGTELFQHLGTLFIRLRTATLNYPITVTVVAKNRFQNRREIEENYLPGSPSFTHVLNATPRGIKHLHLRDACGWILRLQYR